jgi:hypothetical protein
VVGAAVAGKDTAGTHMTLTSNLKGLASKVHVIVPNPTSAETVLGLTGSDVVGSGRPLPDAYMDSLNVLHIGSELVRDQVTGLPLDQTTNTANLYIQHKALRKDVSPLAKVAGVLRISDQATLASQLNPLTDENPLGLALYLCMLNAPNLEVKALGVDTVTAAAPYGTSDAHARAASMLEAEEVYAIAPLTDDETIHQLWVSHVNAMSEPDQGGERIVFFAKDMPVRANPVVAVSGSQANSTATINQMQLDANPASGLLAAGINPAMAIPVSAGVYLEFELNGALVRYNVSSVSGTLANLNVTFAAGDNNDSFYATAAMNSSVIDAAYSLKVRGASMNLVGSNPARLDYSLVAENVAAANAEISNRRTYSIFPDTVTVTVAGVDKSLPAFYGCAAVAGMVAGQPPQQGFTNFPITGLVGVSGTEKFTKSQLDTMAGGGTYVLMQDVPGGSVFCRQQVSTDLSSIETRELSITKVVDFVGKFLRTGVRKFIGVTNIDHQLLDQLGTTLQGMLSFLVEAGVLNGANLNNIAQDASAQDTVLVDVTLDVPFPCNYIRLTLVV